MTCDPRVTAHPQVNSQHCLKYYGVVGAEGAAAEGSVLLGLVLAYADAGDLAALLAEREGQLTCGQRLALVRGVASALVYVHSRGYTYGDLQPASVLLR